MLDCESIILKAEIPVPVPPARLALLKYKLAFLLDTRFKPAAPPARVVEIAPEVRAADWKRRRSNLLRRIEAVELHQFKPGG